MNHLGLWGRAAAVTMVLYGLLGLASCDKISNNSEHLDDEYVGISSWVDDWSGDYIIAHKDGSSLIPLSGVGDKCEGTAGEKLPTLDGVVFGSDADKTKAVLIKSGEYYRVHIESVGYIGFDGEDGFIKSAKELNADCYLWEVLYSENGEGDFSLNPKAGDGAIAWNPEEKCFYISSSAKSALLYKRVLGTGIQNRPGTDKPNPEPGPTPEPDPTPGPNNGQYGWFELPAVNYELSDKYLIDKTDKSLYFAHHLCPDMKYPSGKKMRNYTVCYSAEEHCPVWVAAPRHAVYQQKGCKRTDDYKSDPNIPKDIQYYSKSIGGGCNKGHMLGSAERLCAVGTNRQVFHFTNIAPQFSSNFNTGDGAWNNLEEFVDNKVCSDTLYEVVGCYFKKFQDAYGEVCESKKIEFGGRSDVSRPSMFYYVLLRTKKGNTGKAVSQCSGNELQCVAIVLRHNMEKGHKPQAKDMMSVSDLEKLTGFSYFPNVPNAPKSTFTPSDWL